MRSSGLSLRYKFMAALVVIPILGLSLFLFMAKNIFERDKIAYVFDSNLAVSKTRAARVSSEVASVISIAQAIVLNYRSDTKNLAETGAYFFDRESKIEAFQLFAWNPESSAYDRNVNLEKPNGKLLLDGKDKEIQEIIQAARGRPVIIRGVNSSSDRLLLAARFGEVTDQKHVLAVALFEATELGEVFNESGRQVTFLARKTDGKPVLNRALVSSQASSLGPSFVDPEWAPETIWSELSRKNIPEGIEELTLQSGKSFLASFAEVGIGDLVVVSMVEKKSALGAVDVLLRKSGLFFVALVGLTMVLAVFASRGLTFALGQLSRAAQEISNGNFSTRVSSGSGGEVGILEHSFNSMAGQISVLIQESAEKARMESELVTARAVQETLFPVSSIQLGNVEIASHYDPASECGGDWFYYYENSGYVYIWIGDATGHGAPAALMTSAARAVASVVSSGPVLSPGSCLEVMNRAIFETSKGKMMMTFFVACIDLRTGILSYSNASHEAPFVVHSGDGVPTRDKFLPLIEINNPRVGELAKHSFLESSVQLEAGDTLLFYTDGVVDVKNIESREWGERRLLRVVGDCIGQGVDSSKTVEGVLTALNEFRGPVSIDDDVTFIVCRYKGTFESIIQEVA